jgi:hypothetical protein
VRAAATSRAGASALQLLLRRCVSTRRNASTPAKRPALQSRARRRRRLTPGDISAATAAALLH